MRSNGFVPVDFDPPTSLPTDRFRLEQLGPQRNQADHAAWMSSIELAVGMSHFAPVVWA